jgi:DNA-binding response OmpR family regulator
LAPSNAPAGRHPPRVLLLDSDRAFARLLGTYLVSRGWQAKHLDEPRAVLAKLDKLDPDLVCVELEGPEPSGFDFVALLRRLPHPPPVVICTRLTAAASWDHDTLLRLGVRALLTRPINFAEVDRIFRACLAPSALAAFPPAPEPPLEGS